MIERNELLWKRILLADKILRIQLVMYIFRIRTEEFYKINMTFIGNDIHRKDEKKPKNAS